MEYFDYEAASANGDAEESWGDINAFLETSEQQQKERLAQELRLIGRQLEQRNSIHEKTVEEIEQQIDRCAKKLRQIYQGPFGGNREASKAVEEELAGLYAELREVYRQHWNDRQALEQEMRDIIRRLNELDDESLSDVL